MLYIAYGSNMNKNQMRIRCPKAKPMGAYFLDGWRLVFRGVADMIRDENAKTRVVEAILVAKKFDPKPPTNVLLGKKTDPDNGAMDRLRRSRNLKSTALLPDPNPILTMKMKGPREWWEEMA